MDHFAKKSFYHWYMHMHSIERTNERREAIFIQTQQMLTIQFGVCINSHALSASICVDIPFVNARCSRRYVSMSHEFFKRSKRRSTTDTLWCDDISLLKFGCLHRHFCVMNTRFLFKNSQLIDYRRAKEINYSPDLAVKCETKSKSVMRFLKQKYTVFVFVSCLRMTCLNMYNKSIENWNYVS